MTSNAPGDESSNSRKCNDYSEPLIAFAVAASHMVHASDAVEWQRKTAERARERTEARHVELDSGWHLFLGTALAVPRPKQPGGYVLSFPLGAVSTNRDQAADLIGELAGRSNASVLIDLHEEFEAFAKQLYAKLRARLIEAYPYDAGRIEQFDRRRAAKSPFDGTPASVEAMARWECRRDIGAALKFFKKELDWQSVSVAAWAKHYGMTFPSISQAISQVRHLVVHGRGRVPEERPATIKAGAWRLINSFSRAAVHDGRLRILPDGRQTRSAVQTMVTFACILHEIASLRCGLAPLAEAELQAAVKARLMDLRS